MIEAPDIADLIHRPVVFESLAQSAWGRQLRTVSGRLVGSEPLADDIFRQAREKFLSAPWAIFDNAPRKWLARCVIDMSLKHLQEQLAVVRSVQVPWYRRTAAFTRSLCEALKRFAGTGD